MYIDNIIEYLDNEFGGVKTLLVDVPAEAGEEAKKISLRYIQNIQTEHKTFNKLMIKKTMKNLDFDKIYNYEISDSINCYKLEDLEELI